MNKEDPRNIFGKTYRLSDEELKEESTEQKHTSGQQRQVSLLIYFRDGIETVPLIEDHRVVIGRAAPSDVTIRDSRLSRQHVSVQLVDGDVWVEDLQSTNGTRIDGEKIERAKLKTGDVLTLGAVTASAHTLELYGSKHLGLENHESFQLALDAEVYRARTFGRSMALLMLSSHKSKNPVSRWFPKVREHLRSCDKIALYSADTVEILLPEASREQAERLITPSLQSTESLMGGLGILPDHGSSVEELVEATRAALLRATLQAPIQIAVPASIRQSTLGVEPESSGPVICSEAMYEVYRTASRLASSPIPVLLLGETGTGKEVVARAIQQGGKRKDSPMICVNCGAIPAELVESTLFGHERGAFTGANQQSKGVFESAHGGTILLDEIGELPIPAQVALLRVLETNCFTRVGSVREIEVDVRVIAATHQDLNEMCKEGGFREDLLYRLNAITLEIPPLRERVEEIEPLARHFMLEANKANDCQVMAIDDQALVFMMRYSWPGNVRELRNAMYRAVVIADDCRITVQDLPTRIGETATISPRLKLTLGHAQDHCQLDLEVGIDLKTELQKREAELIVEALKISHWDRNKAATLLSLPVRTLSHKMQQLGIRRSREEANMSLDPTCKIKR